MLLQGMDPATDFLGVDIWVKCEYCSALPWMVLALLAKVGLIKWKPNRKERFRFDRVLRCIAAA